MPRAGRGARDFSEAGRRKELSGTAVAEPVLRGSVFDPDGDRLKQNKQTLRRGAAAWTHAGATLPAQPEAHALLALMELDASRAAARRVSNGEAVLLPDQDRSRWDNAQIQRGMASLEYAQRLGGGANYYALQAAIAACHMRARTAGETDWERIVLLCDALMQTAPSPIVALNRAVAIGTAQDPAAGLDALDGLTSTTPDTALAGYHLLHCVRGDLLMKMGRFTEAREEIEPAIAMTQNLRKRELLTEKLKQIKKAGPVNLRRVSVA